MIISHNMSAYNTQRQLSVNQNGLQKSLAKLSSGMKINVAGDDVAGLAISEKMRAQIRGLEMASKNALDGLSVIQTGEASLQSTHESLHRLREIAVQAASDTNIDNIDRTTLQEEVNALLEGIDSIAKSTEFNRQKLIDGSFNDRIFHVGANSDQNISVTIQAMDLKGLELDEGMWIDLGEVTYNENGQPNVFGGILTQEAADLAIARIDNAISILSGQRSELGSIENGLEHTIDSIGETLHNLRNAETRIRSTDMAKEMMNFTRYNILIESSQAAVAQANQGPERTLQLLR